jgi:ABC exporter DevA family ATP-binding subunit
MKQFLILWLGQLISLTGSQLTGFALGVWVYQQTRSTTLFALLLGLNVLPVILLSPLIGTVVDRWNRRRVMLLSDFGAGLSTVALAIALKTNYLPLSLIAVLIILNAVCVSFMRPAYTAATTQMVSAKDLDRASGLMQVGASAAQLIAPALGGSLLSLIGLPGILWIDIATFFVAVLTQFLVKIPPLSKPAVPFSSFLEQSQQAIQFMKQRPGLLALLVFFFVKNFLGSIVYVSTTPYILSFASEAVLGGIFSVGGLGMMVGGVVLSLLPQGRSRIQTIQIFSLLGGITLVVLALKNSVLLFMVGSFLFFLGLPFIHGSGQVIFQRKVPPELQGRVFAFNEALAGLSVPLAYLAAGPLNDIVFGPLLLPNGSLASTLGSILGVGPGRGTALLFILLGLFHGALALLIELYRPLRRVETLLPDAITLALPETSLTPLTPQPLGDRDMIGGFRSSQSTQLPSNPHTQNSPKMEPVISIQNLNYSFGKRELTKQVLIDINLSILPGEIVIMTGPSGSGKTTLLTLMGALRSVQDGNLSILGQQLNQSSDHELVKVRRNIGYIFQGHNLLPFMTARQNVRMSLALNPRASSQAAQNVDKVLCAVGLGDHLNYYPEKLSGGQKQRVAIARALVNEPALILADEPTASLDSKTGREVVELMHQLAKEQNCTIVLVTHDNRILDIADRIIHLEDGRLVPTAQSQLAPVQSSKPALLIENTAALPLSENSYLPDNRSNPASVQATEPVSALNIQTTLDHHPEVSYPASSNRDIADLPLQFSKEGIQAHRRYKIVCIDDSPTVLYSLKAFLSDDLFAVYLVQDPIQALIQLVKADPDMVILDINMPRLDGYQLCALLRQHDKFKHIPVIVITGSPNSIDTHLAQKVGVTDCLVKPFDRSDLMVRLFPYLNLR